MSDFEQVPIERVAIHQAGPDCDGHCRPLHVRFFEKGENEAAAGYGLVEPWRKALARIRRYARHKNSCPEYPAECTCGFGAANDEARALLSEPVPATDKEAK